ncbi:MAG: hypothetical protein LBL47_01070 [Lactobacillus sp.]|jgi:hypothetical protein|nr:hypothetical protein [Lactobacillus sp.]
MSFLCNKLTTQEKVVYLTCLSYVLNINKRPGKVKKEYLEKKVKDVCLSPTYLDKIKPGTPTAMAKMLKSVDSIVIRRYFVRDMILLATADHELSDKEINLIYGIGISAGISQDKIDDIFMWAAKGIAWEVEGIRLIEEDI